MSMAPFGVANCGEPLSISEGSQKAESQCMCMRRFKNSLGTCRSDDRVSVHHMRTRVARGRREEESLYAALQSGA